MTIAVQMYRSVDGSLHETEHASLRADLVHTIVSSGAVNEASAVKLVEWLCDPRDRLSDMKDGLLALYRTHPEAGAGA